MSKTIHRSLVYPLILIYVFIDKKKRSCLRHNIDVKSVQLLYGRALWFPYSRVLNGCRWLYLSQANFNIKPVHLLTAGKVDECACPNVYKIIESKSYLCQLKVLCRVLYVDTKRKKFRKKYVCLINRRDCKSDVRSVNIKRKGRTQKINRKSAVKKDQSSKRISPTFSNGTPMGKEDVKAILELLWVPDRRRLFKRGEFSLNGFWLHCCFN